MCWRHADRFIITIVVVSLLSCSYYFPSTFHLKGKYHLLVPYFCSESCFTFLEKSSKTTISSIFFLYLLSSSSVPYPLLSCSLTFFRLNSYFLDCMSRCFQTRQKFTTFPISFPSTQIHLQYFARSTTDHNEVLHCSTSVPYCIFLIMFSSSHGFQK